jgi:hypothetical protein
LTKKVMEVAWTAADEYDACVNLNSLYTMKIISATKLNDFMNDLSGSGDPSELPSDPDQRHPAAAASRGNGARREAGEWRTSTSSLCLRKEVSRPREQLPRANAQKATAAIAAPSPASTSSLEDLIYDFLFYNIIHDIIREIINIMMKYI